MSTLTFRLEGEVKGRLEELEEMAMLMERVKANRPKRPIAELWKELELED